MGTEPNHMTDPFNDTSRNLARWLQEAGRRTKRSAGSNNDDGKRDATHSWLKCARQKGIDRAKWPILVALLAFAFLQLFYLEVRLDVESIRSMIIFVLVNGQLPPV